MSETRKVFKSRLKWCQNNQEQLKMNILAKHRTNKNFCKFWKATGKHDIRPGLPATVGGECEPVAIANMFSEHFRVQWAYWAPPLARSILCPGVRERTR